jgi:hypothetical protein
MANYINGGARVQKEATAEETSGGRRKEPRGRGLDSWRSQSATTQLDTIDDFLRQKKPDNVFRRPSELARRTKIGVSHA